MLIFHDILVILQRIYSKAENPHSRVVLRSGNNSNANSGLAYANANNACSNSNTNYGARLNLLRLKSCDPARQRDCQSTPRRV
nr:MAG TPA: hypothetical protein [Caudoviricetes sp.]